MPQSGQGVEPLLVEWVTRRLGVGVLADRLGDIYPPYLYVGAFVLANTFVGQGVYYLQTGTVGLLENPFGVTLPAGVVLAVVGLRYITTARAGAVDELSGRNQLDDPDTLRRGVSLRTKRQLYLGLVVGYLAYEVAVVGIDTVLATQGPFLGVFYNVLVIPLGFLPVALEFVLEYVAVHVTFPRALAARDPDLFFFDPRNMGGFRAVGDLLKRSYYVYTAGLLLYLAFFYGPVVTPGVTASAAVRTGGGTVVLFSVLWGIGLATLAHSVYVTHRIMAGAKDRRLDEIETQLETAISDPHDIGAAEVTDRDALEDLQFRLEQVRATGDYPTTFTMWVQLGISVLLPQLLQIGLDAV